MASDPLVSIIVPVYRMEKYLDRCMASLLAQSHQNLDIILVDDGSPDRSGEICDEYAMRDARVRVIHQGNAGPSAARNAGIETARGSFYTFVDPDDWVHADLVTHLLSIAADAGAELAVCRFLRTQDEDVTGSLQMGGVRSLSTREALELYAGPSTSWMTSPCAKLFRAELFDEVRFPVGRLYEDEFTTYRLVAAARQIVLSEAELYYYFIRHGSATQGEQGLQQLLDRVDALRDQASFFQGQGLPVVSGNCLRRAFLIQRQLRPRVARSRDRSLERRLVKETKEVAAALRASQQPIPVKALAITYATLPQPIDASIRIYQALARAGQRRSAREDAKRNPVQREGKGGAQGQNAATPAHWANERHGSTVSEVEGPQVPSLKGLEVLVVAYGFPDMLRRALEPVRGLPVTVVDNSSLPAIRELCDELGCHYIDPRRNGGFAAGVNVGLSNRLVPTGDVLLLNPDAVISVGEVHALQAALLEDERLASVGPRQVDDQGEPIRVTWPFLSPVGVWLEAWGLWRLRPASEYVSGAILMLRAEALDDVGLFDERFFLYAEEADWSYRATRKGWRHQVVEAVTAMHVGGATSTSQQKRLAHFHGSQERYLRKHYGVAGWQCARVGQILGDLARSALRRGESAAELRTRAQLYLRGPLRVEAAFRAK